VRAGMILSSEQNLARNFRWPLWIPLEQRGPLPFVKADSKLVEDIQSSRKMEPNTKLIQSNSLFECIQPKTVSFIPYKSARTDDFEIFFRRP
jgi:hypothetical protein